MENNKLIAEFMGMKYSDERSFDNGEWTHSIKSLSKFQTSWAWLMPVVNKIERKHKANFRTECLWNEFIECSIYQVIVSIEQGEMSKDKSCIYDSKKIYWYIGDSVKCKREATYKAVVEFIKTYNDGGM